MLRRRGITIDGIEPNEPYAEHARSRLGLDRIRTGFLQDLPLEGQYDLVTLNHVFEHLRDPRGALAHVHGLLAEGGQLLLEVPNIEAIYHAPGNVFHMGHLYWFNPVTIEAMALQQGFSVVERRLVAGTAHIDLRLAKRAAPAPAAEVAALLDGNASRVAAVRAAHTPLRHFLSERPYVRALRKARRQLDELRATRGKHDGRAICDALCDRWLGQAA